jgi:hypothetical protein
VVHPLCRQRRNKRQFEKKNFHRGFIGDEDMKKYYSEAFKAMHEEILGLFVTGTVSKAELREFEEDCFIDEDETPQEEKPLEIAAH